MDSLDDLDFEDAGAMDGMDVANPMCWKMPVLRALRAERGSLHGRVVSLLNWHIHQIITQMLARSEYSSRVYLSNRLSSFLGKPLIYDPYGAAVPPELRDLSTKELIQAFNARFEPHQFVALLAAKLAEKPATALVKELPPSFRELAITGQYELLARSLLKHWGWVSTFDAWGEVFAPLEPPAPVLGCTNGLSVNNSDDDEGDLIYEL